MNLTETKTKLGWFAKLVLKHVLKKLDTDGNGKVELTVTYDIEHNHFDAEYR